MVSFFRRKKKVQQAPPRKKRRKRKKHHLPIEQNKETPPPEQTNKRKKKTVVRSPAVILPTLQIPEREPIKIEKITNTPKLKDIMYEQEYTLDLNYGPIPGLEKYTGKGRLVSVPYVRQGTDGPEIQHSKIWKYGTDEDVKRPNTLNGKMVIKAPHPNRRRKKRPPATIGF